MPLKSGTVGVVGRGRVMEEVSGEIVNPSRDEEDFGTLDEPIFTTIVSLKHVHLYN